MVLAAHPVVPFQCLGFSQAVVEEGLCRYLRPEVPSVWYLDICFAVVGLEAGLLVGSVKIKSFSRRFRAAGMVRLRWRHTLVVLVPIGTPSWRTWRRTSGECSSLLRRDEKKGAVSTLRSRPDESRGMDRERADVASRAVYRERARRRIGLAMIRPDSSCVR